MANQIHGFTIDYGKFILKCNITQLNTIQYNALYNILSWEFKLAWGENCSKIERYAQMLTQGYMGDGGSG